MELKKKLLAASVAAMFVAAPAYADGIGNTIDAEYNEDLIDELLNDALDLDDAQVRVISAAMNLAPLDASVNISGNSIEFKSATAAKAEATATADSMVEGANATVSAAAVATSGNAINAKAIGAVNDTAVDITNEFAYLRENTFDLTGEEEDAVEAADLAGEYTFLSGLGGLIIGGGLLSGEDGGTVDVAVFQAAYNTGDINASVNITSAGVDADYYTRKYDGRDNLEIADLSISTTAIGAVNSGSVTVAQSAIIDVTTSVTYNVADLTGEN